MRLYWYVFKNTLAGYSTYRLNFVMWRVRMVIQFLIIYFLWWTIFQTNTELFGYTQQKILTYVLISSLIGDIVVSTRTHEVGQEIHSGKLANFLLKPVNYFTFLLFRDISDKFVNVLFSIVEIVILILLLNPPLFFQFNPLTLLIFAVSIIFSAALFFIISVILGFLGFWSAEVWAPRFIFFILVQFLSGGFFPLDIFPKPFFYFIMSTPFPYLTYYPAKMYLGQISGLFAVQGFVVMFAWIAVLLLIGNIIWRKGLATYAAEGR